MSERPSFADLFSYLVCFIYNELTCLESLHCLEFDDISPIEAEQTFVIGCKTLQSDHMPRILHKENNVRKYYVECDLKKKPKKPHQLYIAVIW